MFRNIVALVLVSSILYNNYKLNFTECILLIVLMFCFCLGNLGFYFLDMFPKNPVWNFLIMGGHYWNEFPVSMTIMIIFMLYLLLTRKI